MLLPVKPKLHIAIDLETLDIATSAVVMSVALVPFLVEELPEDMEKIGDACTRFLRPLHFRLEVAAQLSRDRTMNYDTVKWWVTQNKDAQKIFQTEEVPTPFVLDGILDWMKQASQYYEIAGMWGNGASFDNAILRSLFSSFCCEIPRELWPYWIDYDMRTLLHFTPIGKTKPVQAHNALSDATAQADTIKRALQIQQEYRRVYALYEENEKKEER